MTAYGVAAVTLVALSFGSATLVSVAKVRTLRGLSTEGSTIKRWGGVVLVVLGVWFILLGIFAEPFSRVFPVGP